MLPKYLLQTSQGFFFRIRVPQALQSIFHKKELKKAIHTTSRIVAERQAIVYAAKAIETFDRLGDTMFDDFRIFNTTQLMMNNGSQTFTFDKNPTIQLQELKTLIEAGVLKITEETAPILQPLLKQQTPLLLSEAFDRYIALRRNEKMTFSDDKVKELQSKFALFLEILGGDKEANQVTVNDAISYRDTYLKLPKTRTGIHCQNKSITELLNMPGERTSTNAVSQRLTTLRSFFQWLVDINEITINPFKTVKLKDNRRRLGKRKAFTTEDLTKIFNYEFWTDKKINNDWEYWLPLLLLYTGARVGEICQLEHKDIQQINDIWCISVNDQPSKDEPEDVWGDFAKRVKTQNSIRCIPIHSKLLELGFLEFIKKFKGRIFPTIKPVNGRIAKYPCRRFNEEFLPKMGVKEPMSKTLYSFRHTTLNALKQQGITSEERAQLAGHSTASITENTYGEEFNIRIMQHLVEKLDFNESLKPVCPWHPHHLAPDQA